MTKNALVLMHQAVEAAMELDNRLQSLKTERENIGELNWEGNEDYSDAITYVGQLFNWAAADMLAKIYANDSGAGAEIVRRDAEWAETDGMHAKDCLKRHWNIGEVTVDDI